MSELGNKIELGSTFNNTLVSWGVKLSGGGNLIRTVSVDEYN